MSSALALIAGSLLVPQTVEAQTADHRWTGLVFDSFTLDGDKVWTVEDGGRIRVRDATAGTWSFQTTPVEARDTLKRVFFQSNGTTGWAVCENGWLLSTTNGGSTWSTSWQSDEIFVGLGPDPLWDVHVFDSGEGWVLGEHAIWYRANASASWSQVTLDIGSYDLKEDIELYAFDIVDTPGTGVLGLIAAEPGLIFRSTDGVQWDIQFDILQLCPSNLLSKCVEDAICVAGVHAEPWDVKISRHATEKLALCVGGVGTGCGYILASTDDGLNWTPELHECAWPASQGGTACNGHVDYTDNGGANETWRLRKYFELYNVAIFHADNTAIAGGYSGQHLVRDPDADDNPANGMQPIWRDRSSYGDAVFVPPNGVTLSGHGVSTGPNGKGYITHAGGYIRRTTDSGQTWADDDLDRPGEAWRVRDVYFRSATDPDQMQGWLVSQFYRIARTDDSGWTWTDDNSGTAWGQPFLTAITLDGDGGIGVAVGDTDAGDEFPKILVNMAIQTPPFVWETPTQVVHDAAVDPTGSAQSMREVAWAGGLEFWTAGTSGLIFHSDPTLGPLDLWLQFVPPGETYSTFQDFSIESVSFLGLNDGVFVGNRGGVGKAYHYKKSGSTVTWTEISLPAVSGATIVALTDVALTSGAAHAVGVLTTTSTGVNQGIALKSVFSAGAFASFTLVGTFDECTEGDAATDLPALTEVEIAQDGAIWIGGQCGRLWRGTDGGSSITWSAVRSLTDAHVRGMSFTTSGATDVGYIAGHRSSRTGHCIVRITD